MRLKFEACQCEIIENEFGHNYWIHNNFCGFWWI